MEVKTIYAVKGNQVRYGVATNFFSTGLGRQFFRKAYSYGVQFPYEVTKEKVFLCSSSGCSHIENGIVLMSREQFHKAAMTGFTFKLFGNGGEIVVPVPAVAFVDVLNQIKPRT